MKTAECLSSSNVYENGLPILCPLMKFYAFQQNHVRGRTIIDPIKGINRWLIIEAVDLYSAQVILTKLVDGTNEHCQCCGSRWERVSPGSDYFHEVYPDPSDLDFYGATLHRADGSIHELPSRF